MIALSKRRCCAESTSRVVCREFTLIEVMIVVIILAALAAMVVPRLSGRSEEARMAIAEADINGNISTALKLYELHNGSFPPSAAWPEAMFTQPASGAPNWKGPYLERKPLDPWNQEYQYEYPGTHNQYGFDLYSVGRDGIKGTDDDVGNWD